jgi:site-specific recombinase XerD
VTDVEDFFIEFSKDRRYSLTQHMMTAMRLFFRFAALKGWMQEGLAQAIPSIRKYRLSNVPRGFSDETVNALITMSTKKSARDHAIVLLLAVYGVRRGQISDLRLDDIDWHKKTITFRPHKGGKRVQHEFVPGVAATVAEYLLEERPKDDNPAVFLRIPRPHLPLGPSAVGDIVLGLARQLESVCERPCGPHAFRHAFAMRLLQGGQPLKVISDLLGHRSLEVTSIYAKMDHPRLLEVAAQWPEVTS